VDQAIGRSRGGLSTKIHTLVDAGQQFRPPGPSAAAVVAHAVEDVADQHLAVRHVRLGDHPLLTAAFAHDPQECSPDGSGSLP
jgi:hypothetical protein